MQKFQAKGGLDAPFVSITNDDATLENGNSIVFSNASGVTNIIKSDNNSLSIVTGGADAMSQLSSFPSIPSGFRPYRVETSGPRYVVAGFPTTVYTSDDKGGTWTKRALPGAQNLYLSAVGYGPQGYIIGYTPAAMYRSVDGITWTAFSINTATTSIRSIEYIDGQYMVGAGGAIYMSTDGVTWATSRYRADSVTNNSHNFVFNHDNTYYIGTNGTDAQGRLFKSTDRQTWQLVTTDIPSTYDCSINMINIDGTFYLHIVKFNGNVGAIYKSTNLTNWTLQSRFNDTTWMYSSILKSDYFIVPLMNTREVRVSKDKGASWTTLPLKTTFDYCYGLTETSPNNYILVGGDNNANVYSISITSAGVVNSIVPGAGMMSHVLQSTKDNALVRKDYVDGLVAKVSIAQKPEIIAEADKLYLKLSGGTLAGDTQVNAKLSINSTAPTIDFKVSDAVKYGVGVNGDNFEFSTDAPPSTYAALSTIPGASTVVYSATKFKNVLYAVGATILSKSTDNGKTWQNFTLPGAQANSDWLRVTEVDGNLLILGKDNASGAGYRYISQDGTTWTRMANPTGTRAYDNPVYAAKLESGKFIITGLGFVSVSDTIDGTYKRSEWHSNTPTVTRYCFTVSEHGTRLVAHVQDSSSGSPRAYTSTDGGSTWAIANYTGLVSGHIVLSGKIGTVWYFVDVNGGIYTSPDGIAMTQLVANPAGTANVAFGASAFEPSGKIVYGDNQGNVKYTSDLKTQTAFKTAFAAVRAMCPTGNPDEYLVFSGIAQVGVVKIQYAGSAFGITPQGPITNRPQQDLPNSLVRRDYVDSSIAVVDRAIRTDVYGKDYIDTKLSEQTNKSNQIIQDVYSKAAVDGLIQLRIDDSNDIRSDVYSKSASDAKYLLKSGGGVTGLIDFHNDNQGIRVKFPSGSVTNNTGIFGGQGDAAKKDKTNMQIKSWWGVGFAPSVTTANSTTVPVGENSIWFDTRNGKMYTIGRLYVNEDQEVYSPVNKPTLLELSAAPSGFGLGEVSGKKLMDCNTTTVGGMYSIFADTANTPGSVNGPSGSMMLDLHWGAATGGEAQHQLFFNYDKDELAFRRQRAGEWKPWVKIYSEANKPTLAELGAAGPADISAAGQAISSVYWMPSRSNLGVGGVPGDGQTLDRTTYPDLFKLVQDKKVPICTDTEWLTDPTKRGCYTLGDGATTFRVPDYNGKTNKSVSTFQRGDGANSAAAGVVQGDAIRNITGTTIISSGTNSVALPIANAGAFKAVMSGTNNIAQAGVGVTNDTYGLQFNASNVVPTAIDNRPSNVAGVWVIKAAHKVSNVALVDAQSLSSKVAEIDSKLQQVNGSGTPVLAAHWVQLRTAMWEGFAAADGQLLSRDVYPDAWNAIQESKVPVIRDVDWLADPSKRGCFTTGDNSNTTFRVPDYNGKSAGSLGAAFMRGDGLNSNGGNGNIQGDAIRNITGNFGGGIDGSFFHNEQHAAATGVFGSNPPQGRYRGTVEQGAAGSAITFDASKVVPTAADNHPVNVTGCWAIKLFAAQLNQGAVDIAPIGEAVSVIKNMWIPMNSTNLSGLTVPAGMTMNPAECYMKYENDRLSIKGILRRATAGNGVALSFSFKNTTGHTIFCPYQPALCAPVGSSGTSGFVPVYTEAINALNNNTVPVIITAAEKTTAPWLMFDMEFVFIAS